MRHPFALLGALVGLANCATSAFAQNSEAAAWATIRDAAAAMATLKGAAPATSVVATPVVVPPAPEQTTAQKAVALAESGFPTVSVGSVEIPPTAKVAYVPVTLSKSAVVTVWLDLLTANGSGSRYAYEGGHFQRVNPLLSWKPGDPLTQWVAVPILRGEDGLSFSLTIPNSAPVGARVAAARGTITFKASAPTQTPPVTYAALPLRTPQKGALAYEFEAADFKASDAGGAGVWRTRFSHGRTQDGNQEIGYYTDPTLHAGTRPFEIRDGALILRAERFTTPKVFKVAGVDRTYQYGSAVLQVAWLSQLYGCYEWELQLPSTPGTWDGLWLLPSDGSWPPEIDVSEGPRNGAFGPGDGSVSMHWGTASAKASVTVLLTGKKIFADPAFDLTTQWHTRAVDWREDWTTFYIDGREVARMPTTFHKPAFPMMDVAVGGWGGTPDFSKGAPEMLVRGFRVFR